MAVVAAVVAVVAWRLRRREVYLMDFACFRPDDSLKVTYKRFMHGSRVSGVRSRRGKGLCWEERGEKDAVGLSC